MLKKPVIIHVVNSTILSGLEKVAIEIINSLNDKYDFYYATKDGIIIDVLEEYKIKRIKINKVSIKEIRRITKEYKPSIIHAHDYTASVICGVSFIDSIIISHLHNNSPWIKKIYHPFCYAYLFASFKVKKILTVSDSIEKEYVFSKFIKRKIENIANPLSIKEIRSKVINIECLKKEYEVCFVGRLTKPKEPQKFIKIIYELKKEFPKIKAIIIGDGELKSECEELIESLNLKNNINMSGYLKNPYQEMAKSKIFCLNSEWEGFGLVAFEALSLGIPCVVSNVGGLVDIVDNECGMLCNNDFDFINEIKLLLYNNNYYNMKLNSARIKAEKLDNYSRYIKKIIDTYGRILKCKN
jgi:glycosyltransferase involved in cell wall biosynthesis